MRTRALELAHAILAACEPALEIPDRLVRRRELVLQHLERLGVGSARGVRLDGGELRLRQHELLILRLESLCEVVDLPVLGVVQRDVRVDERQEGTGGEQAHIDAESPRQLDPDALGLMSRVIVHVIAPIEAGMTGLSAIGNYGAVL